ncbi:hypothetical protein [Pseudomonas helleri]|uniref:hypothetical protein n=1 Tax=Pseudomonas helleri TaxID=1608996 RepID=UPI001885BE93|nr:hypothetical protein [Pseudomonas helleri]
MQASYRSCRRGLLARCIPDYRLICLAEPATDSLLALTATATATATTEVSTTTTTTTTVAMTTWRHKHPAARQRRHRHRYNQGFNQRLQHHYCVLTFN